MNNFLKQVYTNVMGQYPWEVSSHSVDLEILCECQNVIYFHEPRGHEETNLNIDVVETFASPLSEHA
jgi:hypothetical protein